jgi:nitric oxide reductase NorQ protein
VETKPKESEESKDSKKSGAAVGFGSQGSKRKEAELALTQTKIKTQVNDTRVRISMSKATQKPPLYSKYDIQKYDLKGSYIFPEAVQSLIPVNTPEYVDRGEKYIERITRALYYFKQCSLIGPSGTGKTHVVYIVAEITGLPIWEINCGLQTSSYDMFGRYIGLGKENWIDGQIIAWCRMGGLLYLDEANMMKQDIATRLNPLLDTRGHIVLTEKDNEIVSRHPYGYVIIAMNPFSSEFAGTKPLNAAFRRRMSVWIDFDYLSVGEKICPDEVKLIQKRSGLDEDVASKIVRVGAELRRQYKNGDLPYGPSPGDLMNWATLIADGSTPQITAEETIIGMTSDDVEIQQIVRDIINSVFGASKK